MKTIAFILKAAVIGIASFVVLLILTIAASHAAYATVAPEEFHDVERLVRSNWTPVEETPSAERLRLPDPRKTFTGDCDDFAGAAARALHELGYEPAFVVVEKKGRGRHTLVCDEQWCIDADVGYPYHRSGLSARYSKVIADIVIPTKYFSEEYK